MTTQTAQEKLQQFTDVVTNPDKLIEELNITSGTAESYPAVQYNMNFFWQFSEHPQYKFIMQNILMNCYEMFLKTGKSTAKEFADIVSHIFKQQLRMS